MKILIIRFSSLGDIVLTQPIATILRNKYPNAKIDYLTKPQFKTLVLAFGNIDNVYLWQQPKKALLNQLRSEKYDLVIDLHSKLNSLISRLIINAKKTVVYNKHHMLRKMIVRKLTSSSIYSTVDLYNTALKKIRINEERTNPRLNPIDDNQDKINELIHNYNIRRDRTLIGIFPGATHKTKRYPINNIACFINSIPDTWNCSFLILGSVEDKYSAFEIQRFTEKKVYDLCGTVNIGELINLIDRMDGIISNDSGPMHIAAALNKPQIAIFGATHTKLGFRPLNENAIIMQSDIKCQPCSLHGGKSCPKSHFKCMLSITPAKLKSEFLSLLEDKIWSV